MLQVVKMNIPHYKIRDYYKNLITWRNGRRDGLKRDVLNQNSRISSQKIEFLFNTPETRFSSCLRHWSDFSLLKISSVVQYLCIKSWTGVPALQQLDILSDHFVSLVFSS